MDGEERFVIANLSFVIGHFGNDQFQISNDKSLVCSFTVSLDREQPGK
jgi:hypothetical protein